MDVESLKKVLKKLDKVERRGIGYPFDVLLTNDQNTLLTGISHRVAPEIWIAKINQSGGFIFSNYVSPKKAQ